MQDFNQYENTNRIEEQLDNLRDLNQILPPNNLLILHLNVRGLNTNHNNLELLIESMDIKPDVIVCTETWKLEYHKLYNIDNYEIYYNQGSINKADGVVVYVKSSLTHTTEIEEMGLCKILTAIIKTKNNTRIKISGLYRSHDIPKEIFNTELRNYLETNKNIKHHCIVGDFNINILKSDGNSDMFVSNLVDMGYIPFFSDVTRPNNLEGSCIDNIFVKSNLIKIKSYTYTNVFTDHYPIFISIDWQGEKKSSILKAAIDYKKLTKLGQKVDLTHVLDIQDPNHAINTLIDEIHNLVIKATFKDKQKIKNKKNIPRKNWITSGIIISCNTKEALYNLWKLNKNNVNMKNEYNRYCKILNKVIKCAKNEYDKNVINANLNNSKKLWQYINKKLGRNEKAKNDIECLRLNDKIVSKPKDIADTLIEHFSEIGIKLANNLGLDNKIIRKASDKIPRNSKSIFIKPITVNEVIKTINNLKDKAGGRDEISTKIIKNLMHCISRPLEYILNLCISKAVWPSALKTALIVPIFKLGNRENPGNYRPISLISNLAKIFEKLMHNRIYDFMAKCNIFSKKQFGFLKNKSTSDAHAYITKYVYESYNSDNNTIIVFLDLAKAFDTVNHSILLDKLEKYGIRGIASNLIKDYLNNRTQILKYKDNISREEHVKIGVPQGTILGPLLFVLYINDMFDNVNYDSLVSYADDTAVLCTGKNWAEVQSLMNNRLAEVSLWLKHNQLTLNVDKTVYMTFCCYKDSLPKNIRIHINNTDLVRVDNCKYLGIHIDYLMKWDIHLKNLIRKVRYCEFILYKLSYIMDHKTLKMVYHALFESVINYGIIAWGGAYKNVTCPLISMQKRILKKFGASQNTPLNIKQRFVLNSLLHFYDACRNLYNRYDGRSRHKNIKIPKVKKSRYYKSPYYVAIKYYNLLPTEYKNLTVMNKANKCKLKKWLVSTQNHLDL